MSEPKTVCSKCGREILSTTSTRTGGLCMPCKKGRPNRNDPVEVSCEVESLAIPSPQFFTSAQDLLSALEKTEPIGNESHPNKYELDAQKALLRHAILYRVNFHLHDDHWGRTGYALLDLFEQGKAAIQLAGKRFEFSEVTKEDWKGGDDDLSWYGGFLYRDATGAVIYKRVTWIS